MATARSKRICLVGLHGSGYQFVADQPKGTELWGLNEVNRTYPDVKWARLFQLHPLNWREKEREDEFGRLPKGLDRNCFGRNKEYVDWLRAVDCPVYMQKQFFRIPTCVAYPYEKVREKVGVRVRSIGQSGGRERDHYLASTAVAMLALALAEGEATEIALAGIENCGSWREIRFEKGAMEYYIGLAEGMGVPVYRSPHMPRLAYGLLDASLYAVEPDPEYTYMQVSDRGKFRHYRVDTVTGRMKMERATITYHVEPLSQARAR